jgi:hypothetical protein
MSDDETSTDQTQTPPPFQTVVVSKCHAGGTFGNDGNGAAAVVTKCNVDDAFGNDSPGFIRVRKRRLKGSQRSFGGVLQVASVSFDLVKAMRIGGKPRHKFVLGLGSQKNGDTGRQAALMLLLAVGRMKAHGLNEIQRRALLAELIRKGARRPTIAEGEGWYGGSDWKPYVDELVGWLKQADEAAP